MRVGESIANELRDRILDGVYVDSLPKQEALVEEFQTSPPSIREAFRVLEAEGLILVRRENVGGAVVTLPGVENTAHALGLGFRATQTKVSDVAAAIWSIEPVAVRLCAGRADRETAVVPALNDAIERMVRLPADGDWEYAAEQFHDRIAECCGNPAITSILLSLSSVYRSHMEEYRETHARSYITSAVDRAAILKEHQEIARRISRGQGASATNLDAAHLERTMSPLLRADEIIGVAVPRSSARRRQRAVAR